MPLEAPPSSEATLASRAKRVGFCTRAYPKPCFGRLARGAGIGGRLVDGNRHGAGRGIGRLAGVDGAGRENRALEGSPFWELLGNSSGSVKNLQREKPRRRSRAGLIARGSRYPGRGRSPPKPPRPTGATRRSAGGRTAIEAAGPDSACPTHEAWLDCSHPEQVADAIRCLAVRGAPAIGVAAAYGLVLGIQTVRGQEGLAAPLFLAEVSELLGRHPADRGEPALGPREGSARSSNGAPPADRGGGRAARDSPRLGPDALHAEGTSG